MSGITTKHGDQGQTGLLYGGRVSKNDPRCEAYGTVDEAISLLGLARATTEDAKIKSVIKGLQVSLFSVGAELATDVNEYDKFKSNFSAVTSAMTQKIEDSSKKLESSIKLPRSFIIPGASQTSATLDIARSTLRRAERRTVGLKEQGLLTNDEIIRYLNRLSDYLFMLARQVDKEKPIEALSDDNI